MAAANRLIVSDRCYQKYNTFILQRNINVALHQETVKMPRIGPLWVSYGQN
jgi:hypothetical protein